MLLMETNLMSRFSNNDTYLFDENTTPLLNNEDNMTKP